MAGVGTIIALSIVEVIGIIVLLISAYRRFTNKTQKANRVVNIAAIILIICSSLSIAVLGRGIDAGFLNTSVTVIIISIVLLVWNNWVRVLGRS